jgi:type VII secretion-associated serine protease mycosin
MLTPAARRAAPWTPGAATPVAATLAALTLTALTLTVALAGGIGAPAASAQGVGQQIRAAELPELRQIDVPAAWRVTRGAGVTVAVLDTGTDAGVPDLAGSVTTGPDYTKGADPPGYQPPHLHGTYIASLIAGHGSGPGRSGGVIGVAPAAKILAVRVILDDQEPGFAIYNENANFSSAIPDGIRYAVSHGAEVINMSLGSTSPTRDTRLAIGYAVSHDVIVVASAGNDGSAGGGFTPYSYPASFTGVISVAAVGATGQRASFSDRNASVVISAPGVNVVGAGPGGAYLSGSGTSPASAFVAGVAALIRSKYPRLTPALVTQALVASAQHRPAGGYSPGVGFGEVNAVAALAAAARLADQPAITGLRASAHFGGSSPGPIQVVHRSYPKIVALAAVAAVALLGFLIALCLLVLQLRRRHTHRTPERDATFKLDFP